jgi:hypothetical protein
MVLRADRSGFTWQNHAGHALLLVAWVVAFAAVYGRTLLLRRRVATPARGPRAAVSRSAAVLTAACCCAVAGAVHLSIIKEHFAEAALYGVFFLVLTAAQFTWAAAIALRPSRALLQAGAAASLLVVLLWVATRTIGIPLGPAAGETESLGVRDSVASVAELLVTIAATLACRAPAVRSVPDAG